MNELIDKSIGPISALFAEIGGLAFSPIAIIAIGLGVYLGAMLSGGIKVIFLVFSLVIYFGWSLLFVFSYEYAPGQSRHMISGWRLNPPAEEYMRENAALNSMSRDFVSAELVRNFKGPEYVWDGTDLFLSKLVGWVSMTAVLVSAGVLLSNFNKEK
ncbi:hypothetical protein [Mesorhizobium sp. M0772]|uniref:hypothetical protein n=1 Tax=Mesorhizobium sp. M0772 TaxID=2956998 RepID=UPI003334C1B6